ncbi:hypothetical protein SAMN04515671_0150 [Nakamurella panacisegetis]|uniref:Lipoprotein n=1 Tax=Nakamurella panacisegetis TaxID=1090615 RepID=A0A1H0HP30_9ACTN|nr:hypothetical protein [Nakamurella panacisegetis]SDO20919.1 hypothetical protein SAMN04515671_0150 [Nakamurella panacisegetis]
MAGCAALVLLATAACGSSSTAASSSSAASSAPASSAAVSAPASAAMSSDSAPASDVPSSAPAGTDAASSDGAVSSDAPQSSAADSASAGADLDAASATWFTALCTGQAKSATVSPKIKAATAGSMSDADKAKAASPFLTEGGQDFMDLASTLTSLPAPGFTGGADYATKQIGSLKEKGEVFLAAGKSTASGDTSKLISLAADQAAGPNTIALNSVQLPAGVGAAAKALPACAAVLG